MLKNIFSIDRFLILLLSICMIIILVTSDTINTCCIAISIIIGFILFIRWIVYSFRSVQKRNLDCQKGHNALFMMKQLADEMHVKLHAVKPLEIAPGYIGAKSDSLTFFSGSIFSYSGRVVIGCPILCHLDDISLKGVLAHELAHRFRLQLIYSRENLDDISPGNEPDHLPVPDNGSPSHACRHHLLSSVYDLHVLFEPGTRDHYVLHLSRERDVPPSQECLVTDESQRVFAVHDWEFSDPVLLHP